MSKPELEPGLYLVSTPLGNLGDLSERARETLSRASFIAAEGHQAALRLLEILAPSLEPDWDRPTLLSYRESSRNKDARKILAEIEKGMPVALISDAGTPGMSDPGWHLVDLVRQEGHKVWAIPGPCAAVLALTLSGFPARRFSFEGFLPTSGRHRRETFQRLFESHSPTVIYESPHKLLATLSDFAATPVEREIFVVREMTKKFEEGWRGPISQAHAVWSERTVKGEFTLVLGPLEALEDKDEDGPPAETLDFIKGLNLPTKTATQIVKHFFPSVSKKELYSHFLGEGKKKSK